MRLAPPLSMAESAWPWPPQPPPLRTSDLQEVDDYFTYLKTPQARCRKVVIMGGHHTCGDVTDDLVDGSKVVCMDPPLGLLPIRDPTTCLTLSFGIHFDSTFDVAVSKFNCEVHMFDLLDYSPTELLNTSTHAYFHQVGLSDARRQHIYLNIHQEVPMDTLTGIILNNSLIARPVNILKVDIEDDEWRVFQSLSQDPIMDIIGQVAIEIHAEELNKLAPEQRLPYVRHRYDILRALEARGFTKVAYWDNKISETFTAASGAAYKTSGEIHYVNSNWYNSSFKENLTKMGVRMR
ncbi:probable methyltransferase-like protein 24 [Cherax quadricarinatus]